MQPIMKKPFVYISAAMTLDGKISNSKKEQSEICTNDDYDMRWRDRLEADAILIGANQLRLDDPKLTMKTAERQNKRIAQGKTKEPVKVAVVSNLATIKNKTGDFFSTGDKKILFTTTQTSQKEIDSFKKLAEVYVYGNEKVDLPKAMTKLHELGIKKMMVEGGGELIFSLLKDKLIDELRLKIGNLILGGRSTVTLVEGEGFDKTAAVKVEFVDLVKKDNYLQLICKPIYK